MSLADEADGPADAAAFQGAATRYRHHADHVRGLLEEVARLEAECFALSAGVCPHKLGNEYGNAYCGKTNELI